MFDSYKKRPSPYVWVTWVTGLLAGSERCHWKTWVRSHYQLPRQESTFDMKKWIAEHDAMTARRVEELKQDGFTVMVEDANSFILRGAAAALAGKPDIVAVKPEEKTGVIIDEKSGKKKDQYFWQVLIYMFAKSFSSPDYIYSGEIEYKDDSIIILPSQLNDDNKRRISTVMKMVGGPDEPARMPSKFECEYCDILSCPDRYQDEELDVSAHF